MFRESNIEPRARPPRWAARASAALSDASARVRVIAANTPRNLREELARIERAFAIDGAAEPRFVYEPLRPSADLRGALDALAAALDARGDLGAIYAARARELGDDAALCDAAGTPDLWAAARRRFARRDAFDDDADREASTWLDEPSPPAEREERVRSDDDRSPRSLVSRMREEIGKRRLPFRVIVRDNLASLAATGDAHVQVIAGRALPARDVERTVLHELEGHAEPRARAAKADLGIFSLGTARGVDDQEGRALSIERAHGFLDHGRRCEIAWRHIAARSVEAGADFVATVRLLLARRAPLDVAVRVGARVHGGGGLAREAVYLRALLRVEAALGRDPTLDLGLREGRVSIDAAPVLRAYL